MLLINSEDLDVYASIKNRANEPATFESITKERGRERDRKIKTKIIEKMNNRINIHAFAQQMFTQIAASRL